MGFVVENASNDSVESLCHLFKHVFHQDINPAQWRWKYQDPALAGHLNVILRTEAGDILGHGGAIIFDGWIDGAPVPVAQICDVMLAREARGHASHSGPYAAFMTGLFQSLQARIPVGMYYGFPGKRPFQLGQRLGFYRGTGPIHERRLLIPPVTGRRWPWWRLVDMAWDDPRLDQLWVKGAAHASGILVLKRRYLSWRYSRNPFHSYRLFGIKSGPRLVGWTVICQTGDLMRCVDRFVDERQLPILLLLLARYGYAMGCRELAWWAPASTQGPTGAFTVDTGIIGTVVTASAPRFSTILPHWQPGLVDIF